LQEGWFSAFWFWRTLLIFTKVACWGLQKWALEIKLTSAPGPSDLDAMNKMASAIGAGKRILISRCPTITQSGDVILCDLPWLLENITSLAGS